MHDQEWSIIQSGRDRAEHLTEVVREGLEDVFSDNESKKVVLGHIMSVLKPRIYGVEDFESLREIIMWRIKTRGEVLHTKASETASMAVSAGKEKVVLRMGAYDPELITLKFKKFNEKDQRNQTEKQLKEVGSIGFKKERLTLGMDENTRTLVANGVCESKGNFEEREEVLDQLGIEVDRSQDEGYFEIF